MARLVGPKGRVFAFEPDNRVLTGLSANVALNEVKDVVEVRDEILFDDTRERFLYKGKRDGESTVFGGGGAGYWVNSCKLYTLPASRVLKLDIEGSELRALRGAGDIPFIVCELNEKALIAAGASAKELRTYMLGRGYELFTLHPSGGLPIHIPPKTELVTTRANTNVLFSTLDAVSEIYPRHDYDYG